MKAPARKIDPAEYILGAVGEPLAALLADTDAVNAFGMDHPPLDTLRPVEILHICSP